MSKKNTSSNTPANAAVQTAQVRGAKVKIAKKPVAAVTTPAAKAAVAEKKPKFTGPSRNRSVEEFNGRRLGIMEYQNETFVAQAKNKLSDEELAATWQKQFPQAVKFNVGHVGGARRDFNNGRHGKSHAKPAVPVPEYRDGKPVTATDTAKAAKAVKVTKPVKTADVSAAA